MCHRLLASPSTRGASAHNSWPLLVYQSVFHHSARTFQGARSDLAHPCIPIPNTAPGRLRAPNNCFQGCIKDGTWLSPSLRNTSVPSQAEWGSHSVRGFHCPRCRPLPLHTSHATRILGLSSPLDPSLLKSRDCIIHSRLSNKYKMNECAHE